MNLPFAPDGVKKYASTVLVDRIVEAGRDIDDVQVVVETDRGWLVHFHSTTDVLSVQ